MERLQNSAMCKHTCLTHLYNRNSDLCGSPYRASTWFNSNSCNSLAGQIVSTREEILLIIANDYRIASIGDIRQRTCSLPLPIAMISITQVRPSTISGRTCEQTFWDRCYRHAVIRLCMFRCELPSIDTWVTRQ